MGTQYYNAVRTKSRGGAVVVDQPAEHDRRKEQQPQQTTTHWPPIPVFLPISTAASLAATEDTYTQYRTHTAWDDIQQKGAKGLKLLLNRRSYHKSDNIFIYP